jgi:hypothetical protein
LIDLSVRDVIGVIGVNVRFDRGAAPGLSLPRMAACSRIVLCGEALVGLLRVEYAHTCGAQPARVGSKTIPQIG